MKKLITTSLSLLLFCVITYAQTPPVAVTTAFKQKFGGAENIKWGKEGSSEWEAEFTLKGQKTSANFTDNGTWVETESTLPNEALPSAIKEELEKAYPGWTLSTLTKIETAKAGTYYEADIRSGNQKKEVAYTENGKAVNN